ncbi:erythromycin esterase family protein [Edaphobacter modestus]|uniref:erythromycin esterase family protein n=1 Tax=Edaphobacter modestus TaxID=388466 RepID=UPI00102BE0FE
MTASCETAVIEQVTKLQRRSAELESWDGPHARREAFSAEQNAMLVRDAERYYRAMLEGGESSWNRRDTHMTDILDRLLAFFGPRATIVGVSSSHDPAGMLLCDDWL